MMLLTLVTFSLVHHNVLTDVITLFVSSLLSQVDVVLCAVYKALFTDILL